ncbi:MAG: hypothetical protein IT168_31475 [Bryobacterales bacterium]|nr:hypothetical protein [Bryobacterales bacterium]
MTVSAHFDGKVLIPDQPLDLPTNRALILHIEAVADADSSAHESSLSWIAANAVDSEALPTDLADRNDFCLESSSDTQPIWDVIAENMKRVPAEDLAQLPKDGASQIDHYIYGVPKREL